MHSHLLDLHFTQYLRTFCCWLLTFLNWFNAHLAQYFNVPDISDLNLQMYFTVFSWQYSCLSNIWLGFMDKRLWKFISMVSLKWHTFRFNMMKWKSCASKCWKRSQILEVWRKHWNVLHSKDTSVGWFKEF